ncbi:MAG: DUF4113 domain-containing protein [Oligoflexales bacterium]|nr:DUF4113 domain-containing protein [Oligoflexales bacterium]
MVVSANFLANLVQAAFKILDGIYKPGIEYKKAGVMLSDISSNSFIQFGLFDNQKKFRQNAEVMKVVDKINTTMGHDSIKIGTCVSAQLWKMNSKLKSPSFTTKWNEL